MVSCSHMFININLRNTKVRRVNLASVYNAGEISESNKTPEERLKDGEIEINNTSENMNRLDIDARHMEKENCKSEIDLDTANHHDKLRTMSLHAFCKVFYVVKKC